MANLPDPHPTRLTWHQPTFSSFPKMKMQLKGRQFRTVDEIQFELQTVLDTQTPEDFQGAFQ